MNREEILTELAMSVETWNVSNSKKFAQMAMDSGMTPFDAISNGLSRGMDVISTKFDEGTIFLPQILAASRAMEAALDIMEPYMTKDHRVSLKGVVVMGSVKGDIHEIGKNVCCAMLRGAGYKVIDIGPDVSSHEFAEAALDNRADIVGCSALMTVSLIQQKDVVRVFKEEENSAMLIFGGAPCSQEWVDEIGGDGYSASGKEIVELVRRLIPSKSESPQ